MMDLITVNTKISSKNQTVVPSVVRKALKLKAGDRLVWNLKPSGRYPQVRIISKVKNWGDYISGLGKEIWQGVDTDKYINNLRNEWERKTM